MELEYDISYLISAAYQQVRAHVRLAYPIAGFSLLSDSHPMEQLARDNFYEIIACFEVDSEATHRLRDRFPDTVEMDLSAIFGSHPVHEHFKSTRSNFLGNPYFRPPLVAALTAAHHVIVHGWDSFRHTKTA